MEIKKADAVLLECLRLNDSGRDFRLEEDLSSKDWQMLVQRAQRHEVASFLYKRLKKLNAGQIAVPSEIIKQLRLIHFSYIARNLQLFHELGNVLSILKDAGIPVIVLKGACLAEVVYKDTGIRTMSDVDLLLRKNNFARAQEVLIGRRYPPRSERINIDLHWTIDKVHPVGMEMEEIWERARPAEIAGVSVLVLAPEDLLLHLILHAAYQHLFLSAGLRSLCDVREVVTRYSGQLDWCEIIRRAKRWNLENAALLTLLLAEDLLDAKVPESALKTLSSKKLDSRIKTWAVSQVFSDVVPSGLSPHFSLLWAQSSFHKKVCHFFNLLFPSPEFVSIQYPASCGSLKNYFYYFVRFQKHVSRYIRASWRMLRGDKELMKLIERQNRDIAMRKCLTS
jgi:hypothetical protein